MSEMIVSSAVPEVILGQAVPSQEPPKVSLDWGNMAQDIAALEAEAGKPAQPVTDQPQAVATPTATVPQAAPTEQASTAPKVDAVIPPAPVVPEKFKGPDGQLDKDKLLKSFFEAEKVVKRLQNAQGQTQQAQPQAQPQQPQAPAPVTDLSPFERQIAEDLFQGGRGGYTEQQAITQARVMARMEQARHQALAESMLKDVLTVKESIAFDRSQRELNDLAKSNPWVLTPQGHDQLVQVMNEKPWAFEQSPTPWADAVVVLLGRRAISGQQGQVTPTPTGVQQSVPPLPVTPAPAVKQPTRLNTQAEIMAHLKTLTPAQEAEFWKSQNLKWDVQPAYNHVIGTLTKPG